MRGPAADLSHRVWRALVAVAALAAPAGAEVVPGTADDPAEVVPGTADDPAELLALEPAVLATPLAPFVVRGSAPEDTVILIDGFEIPRLQHFLGTRSVFPARMLRAPRLLAQPAVAVGRASSAVALETRAPRGGMFAEASTFDVGALGTGPLGPGTGAVAFRQSVFDSVVDLAYRDAQLRFDHAVGERWSVFVSSVASDDASTRDGVDTRAWFVRTTAGASYRSSAWRVRIAASVMPAAEQAARGSSRHHDVSRVALDSRATIVRTLPALAGLTKVEWTLGEQTTVSRYRIAVAEPHPGREGSPQPEHADPSDRSSQFAGTIWTPDAALWSSLAGNLARHVRATIGLRVDTFGRTRDVATQPRGELAIGIAARTRLRLAAGAYRRAPQHADELYATHLDPERTTQLEVGVAHARDSLRLAATAYYADRTHLVIRDAFGVLQNTGRGTAYGVELSAALRRGRWYAGITGALARSLRRNFLRAAERPAQFDQPVHVTAHATWQRGRWLAGARVQLASGLPVTSIQEAVYASDRDVYLPIFSVRTYDERLPVRYELALRVDRSFTIGTARLAGFADVQLSPSTLGYRYSFDYKQRVAVTLPVVPYVGLRGEL